MASNRNSIDFVSLMRLVAHRLLGEPNAALSTKHEFRFGNKGSLAINLSDGTWFDHENQVGGGVLDLIRRENGGNPIEWLCKEKFVEDSSFVSWPYHDERAQLLYEACKTVGKRFWQRRPDGRGGWINNLNGVRRVPYRLPELLAGKAKGELLFITEGEKDADTLRAWGLRATCNSGGAGKWPANHTEYLREEDVVLLPDHDGIGYTHVRDIGRAAQVVAARTRVLFLADHWPEVDAKKGGDLTDGFDAGHSLEEFLALVAAAPEWGAPVEEKLDALIRELGKKPNGHSTPDDVGHHARQAAGANGTGLITEDKAAISFARRHTGELLFDHDRGAWYRWTGTYWQHERTKLAFSYARQLARDLADNMDRTTSKAAFAAAVERFAQADRAFAVTSETWDRDLMLLGTPTGTIDLRTGALRSAHPDDRITRITAVGPSETADCPMWLRFLREATQNDEDFITFLQRVCGYSLTGCITEHILLFVFGPGGNGKSVLLNTVSSVLGDYATTAAMDTFTATMGAYDRHPTDLAMLRGARLVTASETEEGRFWSETRIKTLTGGDPITARFMRQDFFTFMPQFTLVIVGNHTPALRNVNDATKRRVAIAPFLFKPENPDKDLEAKLRAEWPGILRWLIEGCLAWQRDGLPRPEVVLSATAEYFDEQDLFSRWLEERTEPIPTGVTPKGTPSGVLYRSWTDYASAAGEPPGSQKSFGERMRQRGWIGHKAAGVRMYLGIRLRSQDYGAWEPEPPPY